MTSFISISAFAAAIVLIAYLSISVNQPATGEKDWSKCIFGDQQNCQEHQGRAFDKCIQKASKDGELTEDEYFTCAYTIYG